MQVYENYGLPLFPNTYTEEMSRLNGQHFFLVSCWVQFQAGLYKYGALEAKQGIAV